jgi:hypothetical protein
MQPPQFAVKEWITLLKDSVTALAVIGGAFWFFFRRKLGRRSQLTVAFRSFATLPNDWIYAELEITVQNAGEVEQDVRGFKIAVDGLPEVADKEAHRSSGIQSFSRPLLREDVKEDGANVRPGVTRSFAYLLSLQSAEPLVQVEVQLIHDSEDQAILSTRRFFVADTPSAISNENGGA